jgi:DNA-binding response OmpR family regulator
LTILIAEDNLILGKSIARRLLQIGYFCEIVATGKAFRVAYGKKRYEAICLDLQLPDVSGLDILEHHIRANHDNVPTIIITGTGTDDDRVRAERNGAVGFLIKPFALIALTQIIERHVSKHCRTETA